MKNDYLQSLGINQEKLFEEALSIFRDILRIDTSNPPGNETAAVEYLKKQIDCEGLESEIVEPEFGRASIVSRLVATGRSGILSAKNDTGIPSAKNDTGIPSANDDTGIPSANNNGLLMSAHTDVVPTEPSGWTHPPFGGVVDNGFIWGRGAVDMKHMVVYNLLALLTVKRLGLKLKRDLVFLAVADEEEGTTFGSGYIARERPELVRAEYAVTEVGGFPVYVNNRRIYPVQTACRGFAWLEITGKGDEGHGSIPLENSAPNRLVKALHRLQNGRLSFRKTPHAASFVRGIAKRLPFPGKFILPLALFKPLNKVITKKVVPDQEMGRFLHAILNNTASITMLDGGIKTNVIPSHARAVIDMRTLPGISAEEAVEEIRGIVGD
ncbi:MAG: M20/M25/M40 family metallo-hydrolase, partial [Deltaproteobacteria bacterium]|nr:M20/M25/M40 family metallo-hydrolase [Deltaproteobacteria bacterium]